MPTRCASSTKRSKRTLRMLKLLQQPGQPSAVALPLPLSLLTWQMPWQISSALLSLSEMCAILHRHMPFDPWCVPILSAHARTAPRQINGSRWIKVAQQWGAGVPGLLLLMLCARQQHTLSFGTRVLHLAMRIEMQYA